VREDPLWGLYREHIPYGGGCGGTDKEGNPSKGKIPVTAMGRKREKEKKEPRGKFMAHLTPAPEAPGFRATTLKPLWCKYL